MSDVYIRAVLYLHKYENRMIVVCSYDDVSFFRGLEDHDVIHPFIEWANDPYYSYNVNNASCMPIDKLQLCVELDDELYIWKGWQWKEDKDLYYTAA